MLGLVKMTCAGHSRQQRKHNKTKTDFSDRRWCDLTQVRRFTMSLVRADGRVQLYGDLKIGGINRV